MTLIRWLPFISLFAAQFVLNIQIPFASAVEAATMGAHLVIHHATSALVLALRYTKAFILMLFSRILGLFGRRRIGKRSMGWSNVGKQGIGQEA